MSIENCFLLGAGHGTRMGEIGKKLPKCLWPIFDKTLLEVEIAFAQSLGAKNIWMNIHHQHEMIEKFVIEKGLNINLLYESELLDSGGAFYNFIEKTNVKGKLLFINADLLYFFPFESMNQAIKELDENDICLFGLNVKGGGKYNKLKAKNNLLEEVTLPDSHTAYITYSGVGVLNISSVDKEIGPYKFFQSIASPKNKKVRIITVDRPYEYIDFGKKDLYVQSLEKILRNELPLGLNFLRKNSIIDMSLVDSRNDSYNSKKEYHYNLKGVKDFQIDKKNKSIIYRDLKDTF